MLIVSYFMALMMQASSGSFLQTILDERIALGHNPGIAAALITPEGTFEAVSGLSGSPDRLPLSTTTLFEIGSITKVVTGVLFADSIARGEVHEDELLVEVLAELKLPPGGEKIKLVDLATHHSGLPTYPPGHVPRDISNPWADITAEVVQRSLAGLEELNFEPGTGFEYSNLASGLLGQALVRRASSGMKIENFEDLVQSRFVETFLDLSGIREDRKFFSTTGDRAREFAQGHDSEGAVPHWTLDYLVAAGGIVSNIETMKAFAKACLQGEHMYPAISEAQRARREVGNSGEKIGLHWFVHESETEGEIFWHNGGTGGFRSWLGCNPATGRAAVVLTNSVAAGVDDIGLHLVDPENSPLKPPAPRPQDDTEQSKETGNALNEEVTKELEGRYKLGAAWYTISRGSGGRLEASAPNRGRFGLLPIPDSPLRWRVRQIDATVEFYRGDSGKIEAFDLVHDKGRQRAERELVNDGDIQI